MSRAARNLTHRSHRLRHSGGISLTIGLILWIGLWLATSYSLNAQIDTWVESAKTNNATFSYTERTTDGSPWKLHVHMKGFNYKHAKGHRLEADEAIFYLYIWDWSHLTAKFKGLIRGQVEDFSFATESLKLGFEKTDTATFEETGLFLHAQALGVRPHLSSDPLLGRRINELDFDINLNGPTPNFDDSKSVHQWTQNGGLIHIENLQLSWGTLSLVGQGTLALNDELQPEGVFSNRTKGITQTLNLCAEQECLSPLEERMLKVSLNVLSKSSESSTPVVPVSIQNAGLYIGPVKIGSIPKIKW